MILLEIDVSGVVAVEFECEAPRPIHMHRVAGRTEAAESMEIEPWQVHVLGPFSGFQAIKPNKNALVKPSIDLAGFPGLEQVQ
jgi:hypothetical protein